MELLASLFGRARPKPARASRATGAPGLGVTATRAQLVRMAHRDTLRRHGIPEQWLAVEALAAKDARGNFGVHARFVVKNGQSGLLVHLPQVIELFRTRLAKLDQTSGQWLCGASTRFEFAAGHVYEPMPPAGFWQGVERPEREPAAETTPRESARDWLDRMFAASSSSRAAHNDFRPTQPMYGPQDA